MSFTFTDSDLTLAHLGMTALCIMSVNKDCLTVTASADRGEEGSAIDVNFFQFVQEKDQRFSICSW